MRYARVASVALLCMVAISCHGCRKARKSMAGVGMTPASVEIVEKLKGMPPWDTVAPGDNQANARILQVLEDISAHYSLEETRSAIVAYESQPPPDDIWYSRLYVLEKYVLDVPDAWVPEKSLPLLAERWQEPRNDQVNLLWPFSRGPRGQLMLTGFFVTPAIRMGEPFNALGTFDFFKEQFGRRTIDSSHGGARP